MEQVRRVRPQQPEPRAETRHATSTPPAVTYAGRRDGDPLDLRHAAPPSDAGAQRPATPTPSGTSSTSRVRGAPQHARRTAFDALDPPQHRARRSSQRGVSRSCPSRTSVQTLPLAVERREDNPRFVRWSGTDTVLGAAGRRRRTTRRLRSCRPEHLCTPARDVRATAARVEYAEVQDLTQWQHPARRGRDTTSSACNAYLHARRCSGPQASGPTPLGRYLTEQPIAFCQIVLRQDIVDAAVVDDPRSAERIAKHQRGEPARPGPVPQGRAGAQPLDSGRPGGSQWHCQIHRDAFSYGEVPPNIDSRWICRPPLVRHCPPAVRSPRDDIPRSIRHLRHAAADLPLSPAPPRRSGCRLRQDDELTSPASPANVPGGSMPSLVEFLSLSLWLASFHIAHHLCDCRGSITRCLTESPFCRCVRVSIFWFFVTFRPDLFQQCRC